MKFNLSNLSADEMRVISDALESYECELVPDSAEFALCEGLQHRVLAEAGPDVLWDEDEKKTA